MLYEIIGYIASGLVAISLLMRSILYLRIINFVGAAVFVIYGLLIDAYPVAIVNAIIILINLYYLWQMRNRTEYFHLLPVQASSDYLKNFVDFYADDIQTYMPGFSFDPAHINLSLLVLRDMVPAGVFLGEQQGNTLHVALDYVIPGYRDLKSGRFIYERNRNVFTERGIETVISPSGNARHQRYLAQVDFQKQGNQYTKQI